MNTISKRPFRISSITENVFSVFCILWLIDFILYLPAAKAGMVGDFPDWLNHIRNTPKREYLNWNIGGVTTLYQFTQAVTWVLYKIWGAYHWPWHIVQLTMHVISCTLLYQLFRQLLTSLQVNRASHTSFWIALLFCVSPYASEVIVYEPCFHFSLSLIMMLFILLCVQQYICKPRPVLIWLAGIVYFFSTYSLELFYLTPFFTVSLLLFYYKTGLVEKRTFKKSLLLFLLPQVIFFAVEQAIYHQVYGSHPPHSMHLSANLWQIYLGNPAKYLFHILVLGRYYDEDTKQVVYQFLGNGSFIIIFYGILFLSLAILLIRFRKIQGKGKVTALAFTWCIFILAFVMPLWFYDTLLILFDRYAYFPAVFTYALMIILISYIPKRWVVNSILSLFLLVNIWFTCQTNLIWQQSAAITKTLLRTFPKVDKNKTILLLNLPQCYKGALMIRAIGGSEFKLMHNLFYPDSLIENKVYDVEAYNMLEPQDGVHIMVVYDSVCHVTLNQFGNFWWYNDHGATSYENEDYKVNMIDVGHWYELTLKHPASDYVLLYTVDDQWRIVDWNNKNVDQY